MKKENKDEQDQEKDRDINVDNCPHNVKGEPVFNRWCMVCCDCLGKHGRYKCPMGFPDAHEPLIDKTE